MDPELLKLYTQTANSTSGAKKIDQLLQSVLLAALSGEGFNPMAYQGSGVNSGALISRYSQDPNPAIQALIQQVNTGADQYQIEALANRIFNEAPQDVSASGFSADTFINLGKGLVKERDNGSSSGGGTSSSKGFDFGKSGFSNPADIYDVTTVPLSDAQRIQVGDLANQEQKRTAEFNQGRSKAFNLMNQIEKTNEFTREYSPEKIAKMLNDISYGELGFSTGTAGRKEGLVKWLKGKKSVTDRELADAINRFGSNMAYETDKAHYDKFAKVARQKIADPKQLITTQAVVDTNSPAFHDFRAAIDEARRAGKESNKAMSKQMGIRQGALDSAMAAGKTPFSDEAKARLALLAKLGK